MHPTAFLAHKTSSRKNTEKETIKSRKLIEQEREGDKNSQVSKMCKFETVVHPLSSDDLHLKRKEDDNRSGVACTPRIFLAQETA